MRYSVLKGFEVLQNQLNVSPSSNLFNRLFLCTSGTRPLEALEEELSSF